MIDTDRGKSENERQETKTMAGKVKNDDTSYEYNINQSSLLILVSSHYKKLLNDVQCLCLARAQVVSSLVLYLDAP
jgi:tRNA(Met) C34 N-acetyltransferase TmcA